MSATYQVHEEVELDSKIGDEEDGRPTVMLIGGHHDIGETGAGQINTCIKAGITSQEPSNVEKITTGRKMLEQSGINITWQQSVSILIIF